jgi:hypothetical protein
MPPVPRQLAMKSKLSTALAAAGRSLALSIGAAKADTTFDISGTFAGMAPGSTLSGTITIDVTNGVVDAIHVIFSENAGDPIHVLTNSVAVQGGRYPLTAMVASFWNLLLLRRRLSRPMQEHLLALMEGVSFLVKYRTAWLPVS